ncbi:MAG: hypothetical protein CFE39_00555 [Comamonadaceae bacterium PBBC2]|nr:MAG: hypothetical protein CFE39_00555 [Comamonadaceae bacterium PBBC2]
MHLSPRELQIVVLLQQGLTNKEIGLALGLSQHTVRDNISPMFARFSVKNRAALLAAISTQPARPSIGKNSVTPRGTDRRGGGERRSVPRSLVQE